MATIGTVEITLNSLCPADNHASITLNLEAGEKVITLSEEISQLVGSGLNGNDINSFLRVLLRLGSRGRTKAQLKAVLQAGVTVTIDAV